MITIRILTSHTDSATKNEQLHAFVFYRNPQKKQHPPFDAINVRTSTTYEQADLKSSSQHTQKQTLYIHCYSMCINKTHKFHWNRQEHLQHKYEYNTLHYIFKRLKIKSYIELEDYTHKSPISYVISIFLTLFLTYTFPENYRLFVRIVEYNK